MFSLGSTSNHILPHHEPLFWASWIVPWLWADQVIQIRKIILTWKHEQYWDAPKKVGEPSNSTAKFQPQPRQFLKLHHL